MFERFSVTNCATYTAYPISGFLYRCVKVDSEDKEAPEDLDCLDMDLK